MKVVQSSIERTLKLNVTAVKLIVNTEVINTTVDKECGELWHDL